MNEYIRRTPLEELENTVLLGLKSGPNCLVSSARLEQCLRGLSVGQREGWREDFCRREGLTAEPVDRGVLFSRPAL